MCPKYLFIQEKCDIELNSSSINIIVGGNLSISIIIILLLYYFKTY